MISNLLGTFQRRPNRLLVRPAGARQFNDVCAIVEFDGSRRAVAPQVMVCHTRLFAAFRSELVRCDDALHYDCALRRSRLQRPGHPADRRVARGRPAALHYRTALQARPVRPGSIGPTRANKKGTRRCLKVNPVIVFGLSRTGPKCRRRLNKRIEAITVVTWKCSDT